MKSRSDKSRKIAKFDIIGIRQDCSTLVHPLAISIALSLNYPLFKVLPYDIYLNIYNSANYQIFNSNDNNLSFVTSNKWDGNLAETGHITTIGSVMYTNYSMWLFLASLILLLAMVGAIVVTFKTNYSNKDFQL